MKVSYLGPEGTYSEDAARVMCGNKADFIPYGSLALVLEAVQNDEADVAVLPIMNSKQLIIPDSLQLLLDTDLVDKGIANIAVKHCLLGEKPPKRRQQGVLYVQPHTRKQCEKWLKTNLPNAEIKTVNSNATAAKLARQNVGSYAIASARAADLYGLPIIEPDISDVANNSTTFLALVKPS